MPSYYQLDTSEEFQSELKETLADMISPVTVDVFIGPNCETCDDTVLLLKMMEQASPRDENGEPKLKVRIFDKSVEEHRKEFERQGVERVPTVTLIDGYIRYTGIPAGEEIRGLIETILRISEGESGLNKSTGEILASLKGKVYIETIVTPSCPYCPYAVLLANMLAYEAYKRGNPKVISDTVEAYENPDIADKYGVTSVPAIALNGRLVFVGVPYEEDFIDYVKAASEGKLDDLLFKEFGGETGL
ncbi:MAG: thioredoxin family protein [Desulfurococcales archaeon]|nr:thioredoxin family protein [Desulfurococcales archaeon]